MDFRLANVEDITGVLVLQDKNLVSLMTEAEKIDGFVTTPLGDGQLREIIRLGGLVVAVDDGGVVCGYMMGADWDYFSQWAMFPFMIGKLVGLLYEGIVIEEKNSFQYGPVCVAKGVRGQRVLERMFDVLFEEMCGKFEVGLTFINKKNTRSFAAHTRKLGMVVVEDFEYKGQGYYCLGFRVEK